MKSAILSFLKPITSFLNVLVDWLLGYDIFLSYAWKDEQDFVYAEKIMKELENKAGFKVCIDRTEYHAGMDLQQATIRRVRASKVLLLILRPHAAVSTWVQRELEMADNAGRTIVVININNTFESIPEGSGLKKLINDRLRIAEQVVLSHGDVPSSQIKIVEQVVLSPEDIPSAHTIFEIQKTLRFQRRATKVLSLVSATAIVLAFLAGFALLKMIEAQRESENAQRESRNAQARQYAAEAQFLETQRTQIEKAIPKALKAVDLGFADGISNPALYSVPALLPIHIFENKYDSSINDIAYCQDGASILVGGFNGIARLVNSMDGKEQLKLALNEADNNVESVYCIENSWLVAKTYSSVYVWDRHTGRQLWTKNFGSLAVAVWPNAPAIAVLSENALYIHDLATGNNITNIEGQYDLVGSAIFSRIVFSGDGKRMAFTATSKSIAIYNIDGFRMELLGIIDVDGVIWDIDLDHNGETLGVEAKTLTPDVEIADFAMVSVCNLSSSPFQNAWSFTFQLTGYDPDWVPHKIISFGKDGLMLVGSVDGSVRVLDTLKKSEVTRVKHQHVINELSWLPGNQFFASASFDETASIWSIRSGEEVSRIVHPGSVEAISLAPDGTHIATAGWSRILKVSELNGTRSFPLHYDSGHELLKFDDSGTYLVTTDPFKARIWTGYRGIAKEVTPGHNALKEEFVGFGPWKEFLLGPKASWLVGLDVQGDLYLCDRNNCVENLGETKVFKDHVKAIQVSGNGKILGVQGESSIDLYETTSWRHLKSIQRSGDRLMISNTGRYIISYGEDEPVLIQVEGVKTVRKLPKHIDTCFDPSERWLATAAREIEEEQSLIYLDDNTTSNILLRGTVACDPKGMYVATLGKNSSAVEIFRISDGARIGKPLEGSIPILFDATGKFVMTVGVNVVSVWNLEGKEITRFKRNSDVLTAAFSPDGETLATAGNLFDRTVQIHLWSEPVALREAKRRLK